MPEAQIVPGVWPNLAGMLHFCVLFSNFCNYGFELIEKFAENETFFFFNLLGKEIYYSQPYFCILKCSKICLII